MKSDGPASPAGLGRIVQLAWPALALTVVLSAAWLGSAMFLDDWHVLYTASRADWSAEGLAGGFTFLDRSSIATWNLPALPAYHYFRPLVVASYKLDMALWGLAATPSHLVNLALHLLCVLLVVALALRLGGSARAARISGVLFAIQPQNAVAVIWTSGRTEVLAGVFILGALLCYVIARQRRRSRWFLLALLLQVLACLAKENALILPGLIVAYELRGYFLKNSGLELRRAFAMATPILIVTLGYVVFRFLFFDSGGQLGPPYFNPPTTAGFYGHALAKTTYNLVALPTTAFIVPLFAVELLLEHPLALVALIGVTVLLYWLLLRRRRWRQPLVFGGCLWMLVALAPTLPILTTDLYLYLPSVGFAFIAAQLFDEKLEGASTAQRERLVRFAFAGYVLIFGLGFSGRMLLYHSEGEVNQRIYDDIVGESPSETMPAGARILMVNMPIAASHIAPMLRLHHDVDEVSALLLTLSPEWTTPTERPRVDCVDDQHLRIWPSGDREAFFETREERFLHLLLHPLDPHRAYRTEGVTVTPVTRGDRVIALDIELERPLSGGLERVYAFYEDDGRLAHRLCW